MTHPLAVCLLGFREGKVLAISRRNDITQWGFPGGKVDPGETEKEAVLREIKEEIGFDLNPRKMFAFYSAVCKGDVTYNVLTYFYMDELPSLEAFTPEQGMTLEYKSLAELCKKENSPFAKYNKLVYKNYKSFLKASMSASNGTFLENNKFLQNV